MANRNFKESLSYNISVEGKNCEKLYFEYLEDLINDCDKAKYKVKFNVKKKNPLSYAKSRINVYSQKAGRNDGIVKYIHIQDVEDYNVTFQREKFEHLIDEIETTKKECRISSYELGYTNYTFELWMILHKQNFNINLSHRRDYVRYINNFYGKTYANIDEYKSVDEFNDCLNQITLDDVIKAINRGYAIRKMHEDNNDHLVNYKKFKFYPNNPDLTIHLVVESILKDCGII